jgi:hypothetical protein
MNIILRHALRLSLITAGIVLLLMVLKNYTGTPIIHTNYLTIVLFLYVMTLITSGFVLAGIRRHREQFNAFFFSAMIFRFFASIIFILVMVLMGMEAPLFFVLDFFVLYLFYQVFEIISLMTNLRSHLENRGNEDN